MLVVSSMSVVTVRLREEFPPGTDVGERPIAIWALGYPKLSVRYVDPICLCVLDNEALGRLTTEKQGSLGDMNVRTRMTKVPKLTSFMERVSLTVTRMSF